MGTWFAKLAGHKDDAEKVLKDPHSIAAYTLLFGLALLILLLWFAIVIVTAIRVYKKYRQLDKEEKVKSKSGHWSPSDISLKGFCMFIH